MTSSTAQATEIRALSQRESRNPADLLRLKLLQRQRFDASGRLMIEANAFVDSFVEVAIDSIVASEVLDALTRSKGRQSPPVDEQQREIAGLFANADAFAAQIAATRGGAETLTQSVRDFVASQRVQAMNFRGLYRQMVAMPSRENVEHALRHPHALRGDLVPSTNFAMRLAEMDLTPPELRSVSQALFANAGKVSSAGTLVASFNKRGVSVDEVLTIAQAAHGVGPSLKPPSPWSRMQQSNLERVRIATREMGRLGFLIGPEAAQAILLGPSRSAVQSSTPDSLTQ